MKNKIAAHFRPNRRTSHSFQRIKQCKSCSSYSCLWDHRCLNCGAESKFLELPEVIRSVAKRNMQRDVLLLGAAAFTAVFLARSFLEITAALIAAVTLMAAYLLIHRRFAAEIEKSTLQKLLKQEIHIIRDGLLRDTEDAANDLNAEDYKLAYEKLREIGSLFSGNQVKILKIICLNHFVLRKDMDLELSTLLPDAFDPDFILYLFEVSKVSPELVKRDVIDYCIRYRTEIEALPGGHSVLGPVFAAAVRVKAYVVQYQAVIADFLEELPRDRLIRLCGMAAENKETYPELYPKLKDMIKLRYASDPELQQLS